ncbi:hypothetical protein PV325_004054 [Microctonus aethiopoides]|uniref:S-adenosylmethionine sensor upstream of mTORC1 n=1 Tax=Microctonus aethiopoides TaxID=144406 RepID=A0AA39FV78_9HYME|nr:hypothetical protein PV325_004054 [Microctonus aethiopoides]KAK0176090.1 hypothetical protein PV328_000258 [Microctonus aethiopoides]
MASDEHKQLATIIKETHSRLRNDCRIYGPKEAWNRHVARTDDLQKYAISMQELATAHWDNTNLKSNENTYCRISWIKKQCYEYFMNGGKEKFIEREIDIAKKNNIDLNENNSVWKIIPALTNEYYDGDIGKRIKLIDVGSCYNPFGDDDNFDVTAVDLAPYSDRVLQCDFLNITIGSATIISNDSSTVLQLGRDSFDVCVFSLLLEYFPCPEQRYLCCEKAYNLLKNNGILFIITPDSKHVGANAKIMKSWRFVLAKLGFMRIHYEKLRHIHCICFRKCINKNVALRWTMLQTFPCYIRSGRIVKWIS